MVYAAPRGAAYVFGDYQPTTAIWAYRPGRNAGEAGSWERRQHGGDSCPPYGIVPVAYDAAQNAFVLVVNSLDRKPLPAREPTSASTYLYDPAANTYSRLPRADMAPVGMNFMMAWDSLHEVVCLVTGGSEGLVTVWAMRPRKGGAG